LEIFRTGLPAAPTLFAVAIEQLPATPRLVRIALRMVRVGNAVATSIGTEASPMSIARPWHRRLNDEGSTLVETLIATLVLTTGLLTMMDLVRVATSSNVRARSATRAGILAAQKLEQLLSLDFDATSAPGESPWSLQRNTADFVDHVDGGGAVVGQDVEPPASAVYTRRWSVEQLPAGLGQTMLVQVLVTSVRRRGVADRGSVVRLPGDARLVAIKTRRAS
jgi:hypothetical protein